MKKIIVALALALAIAPAHAWVCEARSNSAWGIGSHWDLNTAAQIALQACAVNTPRWDMCVIIRCEP